MSDFASAFREIVVPDLKQRCRAQGLFVALGLADFSDAQSAVIQRAYSRGAGNLPDEIQIDLLNWISTLVLRATDEAESRNVAYRAMSDRVAADNDRYFAAYAEAELVW